MGFHFWVFYPFFCIVNAIDKSSVWTDTDSFFSTSKYRFNSIPVLLHLPAILCLQSCSRGSSLWCRRRCRWVWVVCRVRKWSPARWAARRNTAVSTRPSVHPRRSVWEVVRSPCSVEKDDEIVRSWMRYHCCYQYTYVDLGIVTR